MLGVVSRAPAVLRRISGSRRRGDLRRALLRAMTEARVVHVVPQLALQLRVALCERGGSTRLPRVRLHGTCHGDVGLPFLRALVKPRGE
eukprot:746938-Hanusia_phi.AAC.2